MAIGLYLMFLPEDVPDYLSSFAYRVDLKQALPVCPGEYLMAFPAFESKSEAVRPFFALIGAAVWPGKMLNDMGPEQSEKLRFVNAIFH